MPSVPEPAAAEEPVPDAILVRSADMHSMPLPDSLLAIGRAGAGTNNIPIDECNRRGIVVFNTPGANANAVAELVVCGLMLGSRNVAGGIQWALSLRGKGEEVPALVEKGKGKFAGPEVRGKTLGVIGLGAIGAIVANAASNGLGMEVIGFDPFISVDSAWSLSRAVKRSNTMEEVLAHVPHACIGQVVREQALTVRDDQDVLFSLPIQALRDAWRGHLTADEEGGR